MQDTSEQIPAGTKLVFSRCDICERIRRGGDETKECYGRVFRRRQREKSPYSSYVIHVAKALGYCLHISHDKPAFEGEYLI